MCKKRSTSAFEEYELRTYMLVYVLRVMYLKYLDTPVIRESMHNSVAVV